MLCPIAVRQSGAFAFLPNPPPHPGCDTTRESVGCSVGDCELTSTLTESSYSILKQETSCVNNSCRLPHREIKHMPAHGTNVQMSGTQKPLLSERGVKLTELTWLNGAASTSDIGDTSKPMMFGCFHVRPIGRCRRCPMSISVVLYCRPDSYSVLSTFVSTGIMPHPTRTETQSFDELLTF